MRPTVHRAVLPAATPDRATDFLGLKHGAAAAFAVVVSLMGMSPGSGIWGKADGQAQAWPDGIEGSGCPAGAVRGVIRQGLPPPTATISKVARRTSEGAHCRCAWTSTVIEVPPTRETRRVDVEDRAHRDRGEELHVLHGHHDDVLGSRSAATMWAFLAEPGQGLRAEQGSVVARVTRQHQLAAKRSPSKKRSTARKASPLRVVKWEVHHVRSGWARGKR